jgi:hypothetical protein
MTHRYSTRLASDVARDGIGLELLNEMGEVVAEVFRSDADRTVVLNTFSFDLPLQAIELLIGEAKERLDPFDNGAPLSTARLIAPRLITIRASDQSDG